MQFNTPEQALQQLFRHLLTAMSNPGQLQAVGPAQAFAEPCALLLLTARCLVDHEVSFATVGPDSGPLRDEISRLTGSASAAVDSADYIFVQGRQSNGAILKARRGTPLYPDLGATVIFQIDASVENEKIKVKRKTQITLAGPGIKTPFSPPRPGLAVAEYRLLKEVNADYPFGVDTIILSGNHQLMAIPRSTRIKVG